MKKIKKFATFLLAGVLLFAAAGSALAATSDADAGSVTVNGLTGGTTVSAYPIAKAAYDSGGNFLGYEMVVSDWTGWSIGTDGSWEDPTEAELAALFEAVKDSGAAQTASVSEGQESVTLSGLPVGSYLIVVEGSESTVYGMMLGSVSYDVDGSGNWIVSDGSFRIADCTLWAKATTPSVLKEETGGSLGDFEHGGSANVGDTIEYHITVEGIPSYQGTNPEFYVTDEISTELTITDAELNALYILIDGDEAQLLDPALYTVTRTDDGFVVDFVVDGVYTLNPYAGHKLVIDFCADVTNAGEVAEDHENDVILTYATTSYVAGSEGEDRDADHEYTFAVKAQKTDKENEPLSGAEFGLFTDAACKNAYTQDGAAVTAVSGADGSFSFTGLEEGTYWMKETAAPAGYLLNREVFQVVIAAEYEAPDSKNGGELISWTITITDEDGREVASVTASADTGLAVINTKTGLLPSMGGRGTLAFTLIGCAVVVCAVAGVVIRRRRRAA